MNAYFFVFRLLFDLAMCYDFNIQYLKNLWVSARKIGRIKF